MQLHVIQSRTPTQPWYGAGLHFSCTQCGNCCAGGPGHVWISRREINRLAAHLNLPPRQVIERYCRKIAGRYSLREHRNARGEYDCTFLLEQKPPAAGDGRTSYATRVCTVYPVRPLQCRTWPFWDSSLRSAKAWELASRRCPGMNSGPRVLARPQIEALRDARKWPDEGS